MNQSEESTWLAVRTEFLRWYLQSDAVLDISVHFWWISILTNQRLAFYCFNQSEMSIYLMKQCWHLWQELRLQSSLIWACPYFFWRSHSSGPDPTSWSHHCPCLQCSPSPRPVLSTNQTAPVPHVSHCLLISQSEMIIMFCQPIRLLTCSTVDSEEVVGAKHESVSVMNKSLASDTLTNQRRILNTINQSEPSIYLAIDTGHSSGQGNNVQVRMFSPQNAVFTSYSQSLELYILVSICT